MGEYEGTASCSSGGSDDPMHQSIDDQLGLRWSLSIVGDPRFAASSLVSLVIRIVYFEVRIVYFVGRTSTRSSRYSKHVHSQLEDRVVPVRPRILGRLLGEAKSGEVTKGG